jgi:hypothetical protein
MLLCKDCMYCNVVNSMCAHPSNISLVNGHSRPVPCEEMREGGVCGRNAQLFKSKEVPIPSLTD